MKNSIVLFVLIGTYHVFAQPAITQGQFNLSAGDILTAYTQTYSAPMEGAGQTWDYTALDLSSPSTINVIDGNASSLTGLSFTTLCTVSPSQEDCFLINGSGMQRTGLGGSGMSVPYQDNEYIFQFPISYGDSITDTFHSTYMLGSFQGSRTGTNTIQVVGYGTMLLPGSVTINNALLVRTHEQYIDSIDVGMWQVINFDVTTYYFYAAGHHGHIVIMTTITANPGGTTSIGYYNELISGAGIKTYDISNNIEIYPNPVEDKLTITSGNHNVWVGSEYKIINIQGKIIQAGMITEDNQSFDVSNYAPGLYIINIQNEKFYATKRFIKN